MQYARDLDDVSPDPVRPEIPSPRDHEFTSSGNSAWTAEWWLLLSGRPAVNKRIIWTRCYTSREFYGYSRSDFSLGHYRGLCVFAPPPYIVSMRERHPVWHELPWHSDRRLAGGPLLRSIGDHFLIVMRNR